MKKLFLIGILFGTFLLAGCGSNTKEITFDSKFKLEIGSNFSEFPTNLIDEKYITNKVITAYKDQSDKGYKKNFLVAKTSVQKGIDADVFAKGNIKKLTTNGLGYKQKTTETNTFKCGNLKINSVINTFSLTNSFGKDKTQTIHMLQYYFVYGNNGYILSFSSINEDDEKTFQNIAKTLSCK